MDRNRIAGCYGFLVIATPETFREGWCANSRWHDLTYQKQDRPLLRYTWVGYMPHATMPEMSFRIWEEFFRHFSREDGKAVYTP